MSPLSAYKRTTVIKRCWFRLYVVLSRVAILWRAVLGRWRGVGGELRSLSDSEGSVSVCGEPVSPTNSRRNLNFDRKSCHTTYHPNSMKSRTHISVATITSTVRPTLCHIFLLPFSRSRAHNLHAESRTDGRRSRVSWTV